MWRWLVCLLWTMANSIGLAIGLFLSIFVFAHTSSWALVFAMIGFGVGIEQFLVLHFATRKNWSCFFWLPLTVGGFTIGGTVAMSGENMMMAGSLIGAS